MFSDFLKEELKNGKTLQEIADIIDVSYQTIQCYITKGNYPTVANLMKFAEHYNLSIDYLLGYTNIKRPLIDNMQQSLIFGNISNGKTQTTKQLQELLAEKSTEND